MYNRSRCVTFVHGDMGKPVFLRAASCKSDLSSSPGQGGHFGLVPRLSGDVCNPRSS